MRVVLAIAGFFYGQEKPVKTLLTVASLATIAMLVGVFTQGIVSVYAFISRWSLLLGHVALYFLVEHFRPGQIHRPGLGLPDYDDPGRGGYSTVLQGAVGDIHSVGLHNSYLVAAVCFAFAGLLALKLKTC